MPWPIWHVYKSFRNSFGAPGSLEKFAVVVVGGWWHSENSISSWSRSSDLNWNRLEWLKIDLEWTWTGSGSGPELDNSHPNKVGRVDHFLPFVLYSISEYVTLIVCDARSLDRCQAVNTTGIAETQHKMLGDVWCVTNIFVWRWDY